MKIKILFFGITTDLVGASHITMEAPAGISVASVKSELVKQYSQLTHLHTYAIAVNESYASDTTIINENDVIAIIPPVSGG